MNHLKVARPSGKGWLQSLKKVVTVVGSTAGLILAAPLKLPQKVLSIAQYIALAAGIAKAIEKADADE